jgi:acetyl-CoA C-acetyltransferase
VAGEASDPEVALRSAAVNLDPRTPVLVGAGQVTAHPQASEPLSARPEPVELMARALEAAARDCGGNGAGRKLIEKADSLRILPSLAWRYVNPGLLVADRLGIEPAEIALASIGGNGPQLLANRAATAISEGQLDVVLIAGGECLGTRISARRDPDHPGLAWTSQPAGTEEPVLLDEERDPVTAQERAASLDRPVRVFPLFANALRAAAGRGLEEDAEMVSEMWARMSPVAAKNPYAWSPEVRTAEEVRTVSPDNRMVGFPYPKLEMANDRVDQGAAFIMCSLEAAEDAGVPKDRMVFPIAGSEASDHWFLTHRMDLCSSPAIRLASRHALSRASVAIEDVAHIDLYSCFPCAVQIAAAEIGLPIADPDRALTLTGGLGFAGGPGNNYGSHAIATMATKLRSNGGVGLVTGLGWYSTKHSIGLWSDRPGADGFRSGSVQAEVDSLPQRSPAPSGEDADGVIETYTVMVDRGGEPDLGIVAMLTRDEARLWGTITDTDTLSLLMAEEGCGRRARIRADGRVEVR